VAALEGVITTKITKDTKDTKFTERSTLAAQRTQSCQDLAYRTTRHDVVDAVDGHSTQPLRTGTTYEWLITR
jgi:hypothetical protein